MATRPTIGQRWPRSQEQRRLRTIETAEDAIYILEEARKILRPQPYVAEMMIADAQRYLERICREMVEARLGVEPESIQKERDEP